MKKKLTKIAQDGTKEGRLDDTKFASDEGENLKKTGLIANGKARNVFYARRQLVRP